jgi:hypothetical protein
MPQAIRKSQKVSNKATARSRSALSSRKIAAGKLASMIEAHMTDLQLSESEKNARVAKFAARVDRSIADRAKS